MVSFFGSVFSDQLKMARNDKKKKKVLRTKRSKAVQNSAKKAAEASALKGRQQKE
jgi:hypothetical protein